ncbi:hypothetical protein [Aporhodopirellula aestuarii]|uniref:Uncharacterized protein n=1 Tax=Aporhodopirellula aestuarii TaxID=2950107 RepID=A0ABT0U5V4_9BACT|nr:hypothetical protein [Aporhodopirellula aestuarii]MCM2372288.1 hypothetical protein [Aporhodopirellula aestuarii]
MSDGNDLNPNRAPWTTPGGAGAAMNTSDAYAPHESAGGPQPPQKKGLGCWVWGCLGVVVFMLLAIVGIGFGTYYFITVQVAKYTDTQPAEIPVVEMEPEELTALESRIELFTNQVRGPADGVMDDDDASAAESTDQDTTTPVDVPAEQPQMRELVLTANELNALIASNPDLRGRVFVEIADGRLFGKVSIPMDMFPGGDGRFFNADAEFDVSMQDGILVVRLTDASVKGERIPQQILEQFSRENLAKDAYSDPDNAEVLRKFESIEVKEDSIILRLRQPPALEDANADAAEAEEAEAVFEEATPAETAATEA